MVDRLARRQGCGRRGGHWILRRAGDEALRADEEGEALFVRDADQRVVLADEDVVFVAALRPARDQIGGLAEEAAEDAGAETSRPL